ncbi:MAG: SDR family oxidoreductase [Anaerolineae bacterium]|nr:SDR family oxidoreductase [Anaerolineae bacterium]
METAAQNSRAARPQTVLVTGADGFIGRHLGAALGKTGHRVRAATRTGPVSAGKIAVGDIGPETDWSAALDGVEVVVHLAARAHILKETAQNPLAVFQQVNTAGTLCLARMSAACGVRRFIFVSSVGVNGDQTPADRPFTEADAPHPVRAYATAKWEAEQGLWQIQSEHGLEIVILRPPLVYGPGVKGNFLRLLNLTRRGLPLPLGHIDNRRSLIAVDNLVSLLCTCLDHPAAANACFLVSDGQDLSTTELIEQLADLMQRRAWLFPVPAGMLRTMGKRLGREQIINQLWGSLAVDSSHVRRTLGWEPPVTVQAALERTVQWYLNHQGR